MERIEKMMDIAERIQALVRDYGRRNDIRIVYVEMDDFYLSKYSDSQINHLDLRTGDEYFLIMLYPYSIKNGDVLYSVNITGDNELKAISELMKLVSTEFE